MCLRVLSVAQSDPEGLPHCGVRRKPATARAALASSTQTVLRVTESQTSHSRCGSPGPSPAWCGASMPALHHPASALTFPETESHPCAPEGCFDAHNDHTKGGLEGLWELFQAAPPCLSSLARKDFPRTPPSSLQVDSVWSGVVLPSAPLLPGSPGKISW